MFDEFVIWKWAHNKERKILKNKFSPFFSEKFFEKKNWKNYFFEKMMKNNNFCWKKINCCFFDFFEFFFSKLFFQFFFFYINFYIVKSKIVYLSCIRVYIHLNMQYLSNFCHFWHWKWRKIENFENFVPVVITSIIIFLTVL